MSKQLCLNLAVDHFSHPAKVSCNYDSHDGELLGLSLGQNNLECLGCRVSTMKSKNEYLNLCKLEIKPCRLGGRIPDVEAKWKLRIISDLISW